jgi:hypothetical protein
MNQMIHAFEIFFEAVQTQTTTACCKILLTLDKHYPHSLGFDYAKILYSSKANGGIKLLRDFKRREIFLVKSIPLRKLSTPHVVLYLI